jgi:hypothetical protein
MPDVAHQGEVKRNARQDACNIMHEQKCEETGQKQKPEILERSISKFKPCKIREICTNYRKLHDPFEDKDKLQCIPIG